MAKKLSKLIDEAAKLLQKLVRLESADDDGYVSCVCCRVKRKWNDSMDGGHFISRTKLSTKLVRENINPQCKGCNMTSGNGIVGARYTWYMEDKYGKDFVEKLIDDSKKTKKYTRIEVEELIKDFKQEIVKHEQRLGIK